MNRRTFIGKLAAIFGIGCAPPLLKSAPPPPPKVETFAAFTIPGVFRIPDKVIIGPKVIIELGKPMINGRRLQRV